MQKAADEPTTVRAPALEVEQVKKAATALVKYITENKEKSKNLLEDNAEWIQLFVRYKGIPSFFSKFPIQLDLPKPIWMAEEFRICLIIQDKKAGRRAKRAQELLVPDHVTNVISVSDLRKQYHDAELKRELCKSFDLFLLENTLVDVSNQIFGARFVEMKKFPSLIKLTRKEEKWIEAVDAAKRKTQMSCYLHQERCIKVGRSSFSTEEITENVRSVVQQMTNRSEDEGWSAILQLYLCTGKSIKLPIYQTFPDEPMIEATVSAEAEDQQAGSKKRKRIPSRQTAELKKRLVEVFKAHDASN